jgi:hypothetical protein
LIVFAASVSAQDVPRVGQPSKAPTGTGKSLSSTQTFQTQNPDGTTNERKRVVNRTWNINFGYEDAPLGVRVTRVAPNSDAAMQGLNVGDYIVTTNAYVCGHYEGRHFPLRDMIGIYIQEEDGWARLDVWNGRDSDPYQNTRQIWVFLGS